MSRRKVRTCDYLIFQANYIYCSSLESGFYVEFNHVKNWKFLHIKNSLDQRKDSPTASNANKDKPIEITKFGREFLKFFQTVKFSRLSAFKWVIHRPKHSANYQNTIQKQNKNKKRRKLFALCASHLPLFAFIPSLRLFTVANQLFSLHW